MPRKKKIIPEYGTVKRASGIYYRTRVTDADGNRVSLYAKTREELYDKVVEAERQIENAVFRMKTPTVQDYCEKWMKIQEARLRPTTMVDYKSKIKNYIIKPLGKKLMADVTLDDVRIALIPAQQKSESVYRSAQMLFKLIFTSAKDSHVIEESPCDKISAKGGKSPKEREALTDEQIKKLLDAIQGLPPYLFVMIGLYAGLRREEILGLQWDCVFLDTDAPYLSVKRAWHTESNRPVIETELKTKSAKRDIPIPQPLAQCLRAEKEKSNSQFVISNRDGGPLTYSQYKGLWRYVVVRSTKERTYSRYINGKLVKKTIQPVLGETAAHNGKVKYTLDFTVTPHQLRHTYITNLIYAGVDPKTVQYLARHKHSKITMDIYAKVKYNRPTELLSIVSDALSESYSLVGT